MLGGMDETRSVRRCEKKVQFFQVHERFHAITLSDNPAVSSGVSVGLGWEVLCEKTTAVDDHVRKQRTRWLDPKKRREMLYDSGLSKDEVEAMRDVIVAAQRDRLTSLPPLNMLEKLPWFVARSVRRTFRRKFSSSSLEPAALLSSSSVDIDEPQVEDKDLKRLGLTADGSASTANLIKLAA